MTALEKAPIVQRVVARTRREWGAALDRAGRSLRQRGWLPAQTDYVPFVILATGRTGSTMLVSMLQSHPNCVCYSELYHSHHPMWFYPHLDYRNSETTLAMWRGDVDRFLDRLVFAPMSPRTHAVGFKLLYGDTEPERWYRETQEPWRAEVIPSLVRRGARVIHLRRRNRLERYVSMKRADQTRAWVVTDEQAKAPRHALLTIDPADCIQSMEALARDEATYAARFDGVSTLDVFYEDLLADPEGVGEQVQRFLDLPVGTLQARTRKLRQRPLAETIANYDDLAAALDGTPHAQHLDRSRPAPQSL